MVLFRGLMVCGAFDGRSLVFEKGARTTKVAGTQSWRWAARRLKQHPVGPTSDVCPNCGACRPIQTAFRLNPRSSVWLISDARSS